ncbi:MAG: dethiobiotin synthase [Burkholderiales bacterium]|nr:dethiobiotin synthase [Burkholderiales bacterium]
MTARGVFVTGTDTGAGKTHVATTLLRALVTAGVRAAGMKPVAAGIGEGYSVNADVALLAAADGLDLPMSDRNPYAFAPAIAPHLAARDVGVAIDLAVIEAAWRRVAEVADAIVVEGAGGVCVPLGAQFDMLDIARRLQLPVLLVVGVRLGCLNHALLSARAIRERGLHFCGWIANRIEPAMERADDNVAELATRLDAPLIADLRWKRPAAFDIDDLRRLDLAGA